MTAVFRIGEQNEFGVRFEVLFDLAKKTLKIEINK